MLERVVRLMSSSRSRARRTSLHLSMNRSRKLVFVSERADSDRRSAPLRSLRSDCSRETASAFRRVASRVLRSPLFFSPLPSGGTVEEPPATRRDATRLGASQLTDTDWPLVLLRCALEQRASISRVRNGRSGSLMYSTVFVAYGVYAPTEYTRVL